MTELSTRSRSRKEGSTIANSRAVAIKKEPSKPDLDELLPSEEKMLIESLQYRVQTLEAKCSIVDELQKENARLQERADLADQAKDSLMRLCWQHLETNDRLAKENQSL